MKITEPYQLNKETLEELIQSHTIRDIAKITGNSCISFYLKKWDIKVPEGREHKVHPEIDLELLKKEAKLGTTAKEISKKYGWNVDSIFWMYRKHRITPTKKNDYIREVTLTSEQEQIVTGSLLGDGHIRPTGMFVMSQCEKQLEYLKWKTNLMFPFMGEIKTRNSVDNRSGRIDGGYMTYSPVHPYFKEMRKVFYPNGKKILPELITLTPLTLAIWYMDDGTLNRTTSTLCTQSFTEVENHKLAYLLLKQYDIEMFVRKQADKPVLVMNKNSSRQFFDLIRPYIHTSMLYKVDMK